MKNYLLILSLVSSQAMAQSPGVLNTLCTFSKVITAQLDEKERIENLLIGEKIDHSQAALIIDTLQTDIQRKLVVSVPYLKAFKEAKGRDFNTKVDCVNVKK